MTKRFLGDIIKHLINGQLLQICMSLIATLLGISQDGGIPQASLSPLNWEIHLSGAVYHPVSLGIKTTNGNGHLFDVTRSLSWQLALWQNKSQGALSKLTDVWISHSHLSHVDGLLQFGKASMGLKGINLRCSELFASEIKSNSWIQQMIDDGTFVIHTWSDQSDIEIENGYSVRPIKIPHRTNGSDTHAFLISGKFKKLLYLTDHDSWDETLNFVGFASPLEWFKSLNADFVLLDGTFWSNAELSNRIQSDVPHPPVVETLELIGKKEVEDPDIIFVHLNHTNPLLNYDGLESKKLVDRGWSVGFEGQTIVLD